MIKLGIARNVAHTASTQNRTHSTVVSVEERSTSAENAMQCSVNPIILLHPALLPSRVLRTPSPANWETSSRAGAMVRAGRYKTSSRAGATV